MQYNLARWVANARKQANLTQEELAEAVGFSGKASVSAIENGRNKPTFDIMVKISEICEKLDVSKPTVISTFKLLEEKKIFERVKNGVYRFKNL